MIDRRGFFAAAIGAAAWITGRKAAAVSQSRRLRIDEEIDRRIEGIAIRPFPACPSGWDRDVLIVDHLQVRCLVSRDLIVDSDIDVSEEVEKRIARALFERIDADWGAVAGRDEVADVYPVLKWTDESGEGFEFRRGALRLKLKPNKPYYPPRGHVLRPIGWQGAFHNIAFGSSFR